MLESVGCTAVRSLVATCSDKIRTGLFTSCFFRDRERERSTCKQSFSGAVTSFMRPFKAMLEFLMGGLDDLKMGFSH